MKSLVVYDSAYGNTAQVAEVIGQVLGQVGEVEVTRAAEVRPEQMEGVDLLVVGSPTQRFSPTGATNDFLRGFSRKQLQKVQVAAFDTRLTEREINSIRILAFFVKIFGYAAKPIAQRLERAGGHLAAEPAGFYVAESEGPLVDGELERAAGWARELLGSAATPATPRSA